MIAAVKKLFPDSFKARHRMTWFRLRRIVRPPRVPQNEGGKVYIHLGCGAVNHPRFINVDALPHPHIHHVGGVERLPMFGDASADLIYTCHCLEHISHLEVPAVLREWSRVLKPGGVLRVSVPDFEKVLRIYEANDRRMDAINEPMLGGQNYEFNFHYSAYNRAWLEKLFADAGLVNIREWTPGTDDLTTFNDWSGKSCTVFGKKFPISLNIEGQKPATPVS